ncbi:hypothetical protein KSC_111150 [Ktedonobacter sp. SOSP1-52]|nr:hypothetical protein [Ktedonobacter sp. SOSP1-52]GHO72223.1 hypothetical protein KSC_111150 [Ktedonobacter sp. SOSP1-52]
MTIVAVFGLLLFQRFDSFSQLLDCLEGLCKGFFQGLVLLFGPLGLLIFHA